MEMEKIADALVGGLEAGVGISVEGRKRLTIATELVGKTAYCDEIGDNATIMINYFETNDGPKCSPNANPAEYILGYVGAGTAGKASQDWSEVWTNFPQAKALDEELEAIHSGINANYKNSNNPYPLSFSYNEFWSNPAFNNNKSIK
jgi:hypothetical protein